MSLTIQGAPNAAAGTSVTIPAHAIGDIILIFAYRDGATTIPTKPAASGTVPAWVDIDTTAGSNLNSGRSAQFVATATNHTSGTWTSATGMIAVVLRGQAVSPIGGHATSGGASGSPGSLVSAAITQTDTSGASILLYFYGTRNVTAWSAAPSGYTTQASVATEVLVNSKNSSTADGAATQACTVSATGGYWTNVIEVLAGSSGQTVTVTGLATAGAFGAVTPQPGAVIVSPASLGSAAAFGAVTARPGGVVVPVGALQSAASFGAITPAPGGAIVPVSGLGSAAAFGAISASGGTPPPASGSVRRWRYRRM